MDDTKNYKLLRNLFWTSLTATIIFIFWSRWYLQPLTTGEIVSFEKAHTIDKATEIMIDWSFSNKLEKAQQSVVVDYFFILLYVVSIFTACRFLSTVSKREGLIKAGKVFSYLIIFAGLCDVVENLCMQHTLDGQFSKFIISLAYNMASAKFFLVGLCLVFIVVCVGAVIFKRNTMKHLQLLLISFFTVVTLYAQSNKADSATAASNLKSAGEKMVHLFVEKNYDEYVKFVHPQIIKLSGGKDKMIDAIKNSLKEIEDEGFAFNKVSIGTPSEIISTTADMESVVPQILELKAQGGLMVATSYLLAISNDKGKTWYFIDTSGKTLDQMKTIFPQLSNKLVIPEKTEPIFYKD